MEISDVDLRLSSQRALWGHVTPSLRSASIEYRGSVIYWRCLFNQDANQDDLELAREAGTEILSDFPDVKEFKEDIRVVPFPEKLINLKNLVYYHHELL